MSKKYEHDNVYHIDVGDWGNLDVSAKSDAAARYKAFLKFIDAYGRTYYDKDRNLRNFSLPWFAKHSHVTMTEKSDQNKTPSMRDRLTDYEKLGPIADLQKLKTTAAPGRTLCIVKTWQNYTDDVQSALNDPQAHVSIHTGEIQTTKHGHDAALKIMADYYGVQKIIHYHAENLRAYVWLEIQP